MLLLSDMPITLLIFPNFSVPLKDRFSTLSHLWILYTSHKNPHTIILHNNFQASFIQKGSVPVY